MYKPKVFFFAGEYMGCWYVRCFLPMMENNWIGSYTGLSKKSRKPVKQIINEMMQSDVIVFHRANSPQHHHIAMNLQAMGKKIVFDNDDTYMVDENHAFMNLNEKGFEQNKNRLNNVIYNFIRNCDLVTCSTPYLAKEYSEYNKNILVLPNYVNPEDWDEPLRNETDKVRIGIVGSTAYHHDFEHLKDIIKELDDRNDVQLVLFGFWDRSKRLLNPLVESVHEKEFAFWDTIKNKEHVTWCDMEHYFETLNNLKLDVMLIPRRDNYFSRCKSNVKFLEAAMCEIPCIVQGLGDGPYDKDIDGTNGILITDNTKWKESIDLLINDKELRRSMGKKAREYVIKNYNIADHANEWLEAYQKLCQEK